MMGARDENASHPMSDSEISATTKIEEVAPSAETPSLATRITALEHALAAEKARRHVDLERETRERHRQFSLLLEEMSKAIEKMERRDLELEKGLRAELTRQNRFIYEEFQSRVARLNISLEAESQSIRGQTVDRADVRNLVISLLQESSRRDSSADTLLR
jgi:hypothetical protein